MIRWRAVSSVEERYWRTAPRMHTRSDGRSADHLGMASIALLGLVAALTPSCGEDHRLERASACGVGWQQLTAPQPYDYLLSPVVYQADTLYYSTGSSVAGSSVAGSSGQVNTLPASGGDPSTLATGFAREIWIEGDQLLFTQGDLNNQIFSVPLVGGAAQLLVDGGAGRSDANWVSVHASSPTDFLWAEWNFRSPQSPMTIWRSRRGTGETVLLGSATARIPSSGNVVSYESMAVTSEGIVLQAVLGVAAVVPFDGSFVRSLAAPTNGYPGPEAAGVDEAGAYWTVFQRGNDEVASLELSPANGGSPKQIWPGVAHTTISHLWPDGQGGWVTVGYQRFDDNAFHTTVGWLDAKGNARRVACSPGKYDESSIDLRVAIAPDAIYAISVNLSMPSPTWEIDRISR